MEEGKIYLKAGKFNEWMEKMGLEITRVKDNLGLLETQGRSLSGIWEGNARKEWEQELFKTLEQTRECTARMEALAGKAKSKAQSLVQMEKIMLRAAEEL